MNVNQSILGNGSFPIADSGIKAIPPGPLMMKEDELFQSRLLWACRKLLPIMCRIVIDVKLHSA